METWDFWVPIQPPSWNYLNICSRELTTDFASETMAFWWKGLKCQNFQSNKLTLNEWWKIFSGYQVLGPHLKMLETQFRRWLSQYLKIHQNCHIWKDQARDLEDGHLTEICIHSSSFVRSQSQKPSGWFNFAALVGFWQLKDRRTC
jgi:hypothetical protein